MWADFGSCLTLPFLDLNKYHRPHCTLKLIKQLLQYICTAVSANCCNSNALYKAMYNVGDFTKLLPGAISSQSTESSNISDRCCQTIDTGDYMPYSFLGVLQIFNILYSWNKRNKVYMRQGQWLNVPAQGFHSLS